MAFPVPAHLPRKSIPRDATSEILNKLDEATYQTLDASVAATWLKELDESIRSTKKAIHERIHCDLPSFERQLATSKSVQSRLALLGSNVNALGHTVTDGETGLLPSLLGSLTKHARLATDTAHASANFEALSYLLRCKTQYMALESFVLSGKLPDAVKASEELGHLISGSPVSLQKSTVMADLKRKFRATRDRAEEQLSEAYSRSILVSAQRITVCSSVQVRQSETILTLSEILRALSPAALSDHLSTLRRDLTTFYISQTLKQPTSVTTDTVTDHYGIIQRLSLYHSPPNEESLPDRLETLGTVLSFIVAHVSPYLPESRSHIFLQSLCKPLTSNVLDYLLVPSLPSSFAHLPSFVELARNAVEFESRIIIDQLHADPADRPIETWVKALGSHYERQRRKDILQAARVMIVAHEDQSEFFDVEVEIIMQSALPGVVPFQDDDGHATATKSTELFREADDAWGSAVAKGTDDDDIADADVDIVVADDSGWGFEDDIYPGASSSEASHDAAANDVSIAMTDSHASERDNGISEDAGEPDVADAWGWNDDEPPADEGLTDESAWDDPWGDDSSKSSSEAKEPGHSPTRLQIAESSLSKLPKPAKIATRLEKFSSKQRKGAHTIPVTPSPLASSPLGISSLPLITQPQVSPQPVTGVPQTAKAPTDKRPPKLASVGAAQKETYQVSTRMKHLIKLVSDVIDEGRIFTASDIISNSLPTSPPKSFDMTPSHTPGTLLLQAAPSIIDLFRAVYPIKFSGLLADVPSHAMRFSNDLLYLGDEIEHLSRELSGMEVLKEKLMECRHRLQVLGDSWFDDIVEKHRQIVDGILTNGADGFIACSEQDRYDECESAVNNILTSIRWVANQWKGVLTKSKYYSAIGSVTDAALSRVLDDVLALPDITEAESHRLGELCRILNALEGLFVEDPNQPSFVVAYVPSWLKFSYLSELLEASMADITYLFEQGALVDFEVEELVRLVRALFADTQLRNATIAKLQNGHPANGS